MLQSGCPSIFCISCYTAKHFFSIYLFTFLLVFLHLLLVYLAGPKKLIFFLILICLSLPYSIALFLLFGKTSFSPFLHLSLLFFVLSFLLIVLCHPFLCIAYFLFIQNIFLSLYTGCLYKVYFLWSLCLFVSCCINILHIYEFCKTFFYLIIYIALCFEAFFLNFCTKVLHIVHFLLNTFLSLFSIVLFYLLLNL